MPYAYPWSSLVARFKYQQQPAWAEFFARSLLREPGVLACLRALAPGDWLLPLPLSAERLEERGFNQAWELAKALARQSRTAAQADASLLLRIRHTPAQHQLRRAYRLANVKGAFLVEPLRAHGVRERQVVLVDDVMTTGASLNAAAQALRDAGARHITAIVFARTG